MTDLRCRFCGNDKPDLIERTQAGTVVCFVCSKVDGKIVEECPRCGRIGSHAESCRVMQELWGV